MMLSKIHIYLPLIVLFLLLFLFQNPTVLKVIAVYALVFLLSFLSIFLIVSGQMKKGWPFLVEMLILTVGALLFLLFLNNRLWQIVSIVVFCLLLGLFLRSVYAFIHLIRFYTPEKIEKIMKIINFVASYWVLSGFGILIGPDPFWPPAYSCFILTFVLFFWLFYFFIKIGFTQGDIWERSIMSLVLGEVYLVIRFLPFGPYFNALIISLIFIILTLWTERKNQKRLPLTT